MVELIPKQQLRAWLKSLIKSGTYHKMTRPGLTLNALATHTGIPLNSLKWLVHKETANISMERHRLLSKIMSDHENGILDFKSIHKTKKVPVFVEKPKPRVKYKVSFGLKGVSLSPIDRPKVAARMPTMKDLLGG